MWTSSPVGELMISASMAYFLLDDANNACGLAEADDFPPHTVTNGCPPLGCMTTRRRLSTYEASI